MSKKVFNHPKKLGLLSENKPIKEEIKEIGLINQKQIINKSKEDIEAGLSAFTYEKAPLNYHDLKEEIKFLEKVHAQSFVILAHRLKIIRDNELYKEDGYTDFKSFLENELNITRTMVYNYIKVLEVYGVNPGLHEENIKITSLVRTLPYAENYPEDKELLFLKSKELSRRDLEKYLKSYYQKTLKNQEIEEANDWYFSKEELLSNSKFLREGMKSKTLDHMLKEIVNFRILEDPKDKKILKIKKILFEEE